MNHRIRNAKKVIGSGRGNIYSAIKVSRDEATFPEQVSIIEDFLNASEETQLKSIGSIVVSSWETYATSRPYAIPKNIQRVITWTIALFDVLSDKIQDHVKIRQMVEISAYKGDWRSVIDALDSHSGRFGRTIWELRWRLIVSDELEEDGERRKVSEAVAVESNGSIAGFLALLFAHSGDKSIPTDILRASLRSACDSDSKDATEFFGILLLDEIDNCESISPVLAIGECLPLVDRYNFFLRVASHVISHQTKDAPKFIRAIGKLSTVVDDRILLMMKDVATPSGTEGSKVVNACVFECWDNYFASDYARAKKLIDHIPDELAPDLNLVELGVKATMYMGIEIEGSPRTAKEFLEKTLHQIHSRGDNTLEALGRLDQFSLRFPFLHLSVQTRSLYLSQTRAENPKSLDLRSMQFAISHTPRLFEPLSGTVEHQEYLARLMDLVNQPESLKFMIWCSAFDRNNLDAFPGILIDRKLYFLGLFSYKYRNFGSSIFHLEEFLKRQKFSLSSEMSPFAVEETKRILISVYEESQNVIQAQRLVIESYLNCAQSVRRMPILRIYEHSKAQVELASREIHYPILASLVCTDPHEICMAMKHYLRHCRARIPSQLLTNVDIDSELRPLLAVFFLKVCTPEVLDSVIHLETEEKVEEERLLLLKWLAENSPSLARAAENDKLRLIQESQLRTTLDLVDESRVVLNMSSLREAEEDRLSSIHSRFRSQHELALAQVSDELKTKISKAKTQDGPRFVVVHTSAANSKIEQAYREAFREVRNIFLTSPHFGLEACLSGRVRHGILVEHIVRPLRSRHLLVSKELADKSEMVRHWQSACSGFATKNDAERKEVLNVLETMTKTVTDLAKEVKDVWIQSRTEEKNPDGLFDYSFSDIDLRKMLNDSSVNILDPGEFYDQIFLALSSRTRSSLDVIRRRINEDLVINLKNALNDSVSKLQAIGVFPGMRSELVSAIHDSTSACDEMRRWFKKASGVLMDDVGFDLICHTAVGMVERLHTEIRGRCEISVKSAFRVKGRHVTALVHVLFFLLENGIKHTTSGLSDYYSTLTVEAESNLLLIKISNTMKSESDAEAAIISVRERLQEVSEGLELRKILEEGGSGFAKIIAAFRYGFRQQDPKVEVVSDNNAVLITVRGRMEGIAA